VARRADRLAELAASLPSAEILAADLADDSGVAAVADRIRATQDLELLVNNAGFGTKGRFWEAEGQETMHRLHVLATVSLTRAALAAMVPRRRGAVINVASVAAFTMGVGNVSYCSTKAWMAVFSEGLAAELASIGSPVRVQALCPGYTYTEFHDVMGADRSTVPARFWLDAEFVVRESLDALERGTLFVIPGAIYRWTARVLRLLPSGLRRRLAIANGRRMKRA